MNARFFLRGIVLLPAAVWNRVTLAVHHAACGRGCVINGRLRLWGRGRLRLGNGVRINSLYRMNPVGGNTFTSIYIREGAAVEIGDGTGISNAAIYAACSVRIGRRVKIGGSVKIYDTDFHSLDPEERNQDPDPGVKTAPVTIGDDVFVGAHCIVLKGVEIGDRSVIGAGSVVTKSVPPDELWAGSPARFIRKLDGGGGAG